MIALDNVTKRFHQTVAVDGLTLEIGKGEVVGFLGPNGAGKTTTMRMITNFLAPDEGTIVIDGVDTQENDITVKRRIGYLPENNPLYQEMLVSEFLKLVADLRGISAEERGKAFDRTVSETGIGDVYYRPIGELSKGYRQRVGLAAAVLHRPDILILDEPTEGLDPNQRVEIRDLIKKVGSRRTVILSTHVLQEVKTTCNRVVIINKGRLVADGTIDELVAQAQGVHRVRIEAEGKNIEEALQSIPGIASVISEDTPNGRARLLATVTGGEEVRPLIFDMAKKKRWTLWELYQEEVDLEEVFRGLTIQDP